MKISTLFWIATIFVAAFALYQVKYEVRGIKQEVADLEQNLDKEYQNVHVLEAEWSYLTRPDRLATLSKRYLSLRPASAHQLVYQDALAELHEPAMEDSVQAASVDGDALSYSPESSYIHPVAEVVYDR